MSLKDGGIDLKTKLTISLLLLVMLLSGCMSNSKDMAVYGMTILDYKVVETGCNPCGKGAGYYVKLEKASQTHDYRVSYSIMSSFDNVISLSASVGLENNVDVIVLDNSIEAVALSRNRK
jgi:hypothetical protein